jgi:hypothetical protein
MGAIHHALIEIGYVHKQLVESNILLSERTDQIAVLHTGNGQYGSVIHLGVIQTIQQMNAARPGSRNAHADTSREFR